MRRTIAGIAILVFGVAADVLAQLQTQAVSIRAPFETTRPITDLGALTTHYNSGNWAALMELGTAIISAARATARDHAQGTKDEAHVAWIAVANALDTTRRFVVVTWIGADAFGKPSLKRFTVHEPSVRPFTSDLPGVSGSATDAELVELFLSRHVSAKTVSLYTSTRGQDPIEAALPAFIQAIASPLFATVATVAGPLPRDVREGEKPEPPAPLVVTVRRVAMPFVRASVRLQAAAKDPLTRVELAEAINNHALSIKFTDVPHSACARTFVDKMALIVRGVATENVCSGNNAVAEKCRHRFNEEMSKVYDAAAADCGGTKPSASDLAAIQLADKKFRTFVENGQANTAELDITFQNRPLTRFSLGAGGAVIAAGSLSTSRVKLKDNVIVADPLDRVMTMAFVNWSPAG